MSSIMKATTDNGLLLPVPDQDGAPFWEFAARGELRVQVCGACGRLRFPPRPCCPHCQSFDSAWRAMSGRGRIWSYVLPHPPLLPGYAAQAPYNAVIVELAEDPGIRLVGNVVAAPAAALNSVDTSRLRIGAAVRACFHEIPEGVTVPRWLLERP
ncbi:Zn-ribbon domain-containing OB-fold protein [Streptantibioticus ferralitis]|uniref:OB-fold domain-containing protein n=1 Tax=Streptantibioticus ferralitis TaxID=236510 RepID=A0ABT5Z9W2_9ACTN|nr:OB-fold domain-containing protein [Streptantibioticus ferralitis]MDF2260614.1 OB-fold domain-containing protein [Streptantibioticus ferralitis]